MSDKRQLSRQQLETPSEHLTGARLCLTTSKKFAVTQVAITRHGAHELWHKLNMRKRWGCPTACLGAKALTKSNN